MSIYQHGLHHKQPVRTSVNKQSLGWCNLFYQMHKNYLTNLPKWPNKLVILDISMFWKHIGKYAWLVQRTLVISWTETSINYLVPKYTELSKLTVSNAKSSIFTKATQWIGRRTRSFVPTGMVIQTQLVPEHAISPFQSFTTQRTPQLLSVTGFNQDRFYMWSHNTQIQYLLH